MQVLIVADIHGNLEAFQAVVEDAQRHGGFDEVWVLGDIVGYGPDPGGCIDLLRSFPHTAVVGNHDLAAIGRIGLDLFNPLAAEAARWTARHLSPDHRSYLESLPLRVERGEFTLVHGSLLDPVWDYFLPGYMPRMRLQECFRRQRTPYGLVGQSHVPFLCLEEGPTFLPLPEGKGVRLGEERVVVNPGGVGQPRDGDPRAAYALYETGGRVLLHRRTPYNIARTQEKIRRAGLPEWLAVRLEYGH